MGSYRQILYHIVFGTKRRRPTIVSEHKDKLYKYISGIVEKNHCHLYRINGIEDHIHILTDLSPTITLADLVKDIKVASALWIKKSGYFPGFEGWAEGYGAFTYSFRDKDRVINYVINQEEHHKRKTYIKELIEILKMFGVEYDKKYLP